MTMTITQTMNYGNLVPGWSRADFVKHLSDFFADFFILAFFDILSDSKT